MKLKIFKVGELLTNCYVLEFEKHLIIIDPGYYSNELKQFLYQKINKFIKKNIYIILTHNHYDHIGGVAPLYEEFNIKNIIMSEHDSSNLNNEFYTGELLINKKIKKFKVTKTFDKELNLDISSSESLYLFSTPGHTKGSISIIYNNLLFSGDTLFKNAIGRYDLPSASYNDIINSIKKYFSFNKNFYIYPGHGEQTTLFEEKEWLINNGII